MFLARVTLRPGTTIFEGEQESKINVKQNGDQQKTADHPEQRTEIAQMLGVGIDPFRSEKNLKIPEQVAYARACKQNPAVYAAMRKRGRG